MKRKYIIHPGDYAIGENEKLYADMAAKGWLLEKHGAFFSRFRRDEPQRLRYRLELTTADMISGEAELPEEQLALYEECGWRYVTVRVSIHVFSAPEGSDAPEIHTDPRQQAATLKGLRRRYYFGWLSIPATLMFNFLLHSAFRFTGGGGFENTISIFRMGLLVYTAFILLWTFIVFWSLYGALYGAVRVGRLSRSLKRGEPIDHAPLKRHHLHRVVSTTLLVCCIVFAALSVVQLAQHRKYDMPETADGPYLLLKDLGWDGPRASVFEDLTSNVKTEHSLLADEWNTYECVSAEDSRSWMYQDVTVLRYGKPPQDAVKLLSALSVFTRGASGFTRVDVPGLDAAYIGKMEYIAVKGNALYHITYFEPGGGGQETQADVLRALAEMNR